MVVDANTPEPALARAAALCAGAAVPLWFEPTDPLKAAAVRHLLQLPRPPLLYTSPNVAELRAMAETLCEGATRVCGDEPTASENQASGRQRISAEACGRDWYWLVVACCCEEQFAVTLPTLP